MTAARNAWIVSAAVYAAATMVMGRDVLAALTTHIAGDPGDPALNAAILAWNAQNIPWTERWYQLPIFYPARDALTFSEHLLGLSVIATPLYWLTGSAVAAYNLTLLLTYPLCALAMYALVWRLTGQPVPAFLAGLAYGFAPYRLVQISHIQMLAVFWAPLALLGLHAFIETRRRRWLAVFAVAWVLQGATNGYLLVYFSVLVGLWVAWFVVAQRRWTDAGLIALAAAVAALPLVPILLRFVRAHAFNGFRRPAEEIAHYAADVTSIGCPDPDSPTWGWMQGACRAAASGEQYLFVGAALVVLCAVGAWSSRAGAGGGAPTRVGRWLGIVSRASLAASLLFLLTALSVAVAGRWRVELGPVQISSSSTHEPFGTAVGLAVLSFVTSSWFRDLPRRAHPAAFYFVGAVVMLALSWGPAPLIFGQPALETGPYSWLLLLPGVPNLRVPGRFFMLAMLCLSVLMALVLSAPLQRWRRRWVVLLTAAGTAGLLADGWGTIPAASLPPGAPAPERLRGGVALTLPMGMAGLDGPPELEAVARGWTSANGYSGHRPAHYFAASEAAARGNPVALLPFASANDLHVIVDEADARLVAFVEGRTGATLVGRRDGRRQYLVPRSGSLPSAVPSGQRLAIRQLTASCFADDAVRATDGDVRTRWHCGPQNSHQQITADLGAPAAVAAVVDVLGPYSSDYPRHLLVETSPDGERWDQAWNGDVYGEVFAAARQNPGRLAVVVSFPPRRARFVRLRAMSAEEVWYWSIAELEIWSDVRRN